MSRENPYNRLKRTTAQWIADNVLYRHKRIMWTLDLQNNKYSLHELRYKIETANTLGYTIELSTNDDGYVVFTYAKKLPSRLPFELM